MAKYKFKKGAASFYIVAFATLILLIIAASFAAVIISELTRTSNADLSQSAYDSALAGVEDGKLAFYNYRKCKSAGVAEGLDNTPGISCEEARFLVEKSESCKTVGYLVGRFGNALGVNYDSPEEVMVKESADGDNNMQQYYTCAKINTILEDYSGTLSAANPIKVVRVKFEDNVDVNNITTMKISWFSSENADAIGLKSGDYKYNNLDGGKVTFQAATKGVAAPPTISLALVQASKNFTLDSFDTTQNGQTNRGMVYLVPTKEKNDANKDVENNSRAGYKDEKNYINESGFLKSNDKAVKNLPYKVYCPDDTGNEYACSVTLEIPKVVGGERDPENFIFAMALPYGTPTTDFSLEFYCADGNICHKETVEEEICDSNGECTTIEENRETNQAFLQDVQIEIDSTGRANDLFRRVKVRMEGVDNYSLSMMGPLELFDKDNNSGSADVLKKDFSVTKEYNF